ncbi:MAG: hypothetical protein H6712_14340 [Myxococcales bacterium]|nr:hypothetical protein [Myxococcales bacterium]MCB9715042.1 hypothetical protein [Myxococcales bacterium]
MAALGLGASACRDDGGEDDGAMGESGSGTGATGDGSGSDGSGSPGTGSGESGDAMGPWSSLDERPCPDGSFLTYESFGGGFMLTYCTGCHHSRLPADTRQGAPIEVSFDDLEDIRAWADRIWARSGDDNDTMPPVGPASAEDRARLGEWLACGAPADADLGM